MHQAAFVDLVVQLTRELGIPAVVGASGALSITDGATVEVDPVQGVVRLVPAGEALPTG